MTTLVNPLILVNIFNTILCVIIFFIGFWGYRSSKELALFVIGIAFGLFGISHVLVLFNLDQTFEIPMLIIRVFSYLLVVFALNKIVFLRDK